MMIMKRLKGILGVVLIFASGLVVGAVLATGGINEKLRSITAGGPEKVVEAVTTTMKRRLKLDKDQQEMLRQIALETRIRLRVINQKTQPETRQVLREAETKVRAILNPEQQKRFDAIVAHERTAWESGGPPPAVTPAPVVKPTPQQATPAPPAEATPAPVL